MTKDEKLAKLQRSFEDWNLLMKTNSELGRTLMSTACMSQVMKELGKLVQVLRDE